MKSGNLNFLEPSGPLPACNGTALPLYCWPKTSHVIHVFNSGNACNPLQLYITGQQIYQKCRTHIKIFGARKLTWSKFIAENPQILDAPHNILFSVWLTARDFASLVCKSDYSITILCGARNWSHMQMHCCSPKPCQVVGEWLGVVCARKLSQLSKWLYCIQNYNAENKALALATLFSGANRFPLPSKFVAQRMYEEKNVWIHTCSDLVDLVEQCFSTAGPRHEKPGVFQLVIIFYGSWR